MVLAKKFVFDFNGNKQALDILKLSQRLYNNDKIKQEKDKLKKERIEKVLKDAGVDQMANQDSEKKA